MNLNLFKTHTYLGKILGGFFGYLVAGPIGAFFGLLVGNVFDKGLSSHFHHPYHTLHEAKHSVLYPLFIQTTFEVMGYIAKKEGRIHETVIHYAQQTMHTLNLSQQQIKTAQQAFTFGKGKNFVLHTKLIQFKQSVGSTSEWMQAFLNIQYQAIMNTGASFRKLQAFNEVLRILGFAPTVDTQTFYEYNTTYRTSSPYTVNTLEAAYATLGLSQTATQTMVKKAYRTLMSKHHPDKLIAQKKSENEIKIANERTQKIRKAYEQICAAKGWD